MTGNGVLCIDIILLSLQTIIKIIFVCLFHFQSVGLLSGVSYNIKDSMKKSYNKLFPHPVCYLLRLQPCKSISIARVFPSGLLSSSLSLSWYRSPFSVFVLLHFMSRIHSTSFFSPGSSMPPKPLLLIFSRRFETWTSSFTPRCLSLSGCFKYLKL